MCLTTLHANNSYHALNRIVNFFPYESRRGVLADLSMCLRAVISQRLIRSVNGKLLPAVEILLNTTLIADQIKNDELDKIRESIEKSVSAGSQTFEQALYKLFKKQHDHQGRSAAQRRFGKQPGLLGRFLGAHRHPESAGIRFQPGRSKTGIRAPILAASSSI